MYYVYILKSLKDGSYYVGSTRDIEERLQRHNQGRSKYTKNKRPWELIFSEAHPDMPSAIKREQEIKDSNPGDAILVFCFFRSPTFLWRQGFPQFAF